MSSSALDIAATAAKVTTIGQLRAAMGAVTVTLSQAYAKLDQISSIAGEQKAARDLLDTVNTSANKLFALYTDAPDLQDQEISTYRAGLAGQIIGQANDALRAVEDAANERLWDLSSILNDALATVGGTAGKAAQSVTNALAAGGAAFVSAAWSTIIVVAIVGAVFLFRRPIAAALAKAAT